MINISKHIVELLYLNDCVIIPEFGGFITNYKSSIVNNVNNFIPPSKQITFNKNLKDNDGLLINSIKNKEQLHNMSHSQSPHQCA